MSSIPWSRMALTGILFLLLSGCESDPVSENSGGDQGGDQHGPRAVALADMPCDSCQVDFAKHVAPVVTMRCLPCHGPDGSQSGAPTIAWDDAEVLRNNSSQVMRRLQLPAGDPERMPKSGHIYTEEKELILRYLQQDEEPDNEEPSI